MDHPGKRLRIRRARLRRLYTVPPEEAIREIGTSDLRGYLEEEERKKNELQARRSTSICGAL